jgi:hypothetical protein
VREIDDIHVPAIQWLTEAQVPYIYHRPDRRSGIHKGHPDFTILWMRKQIIIECKTPSGKLSQDQVARIDFLRRAGNVVEIVRNLSEFKEAAYKVLCEGEPSAGACGACNYPLEGCFKELKRAVAAVPVPGAAPCPPSGIHATGGPHKKFPGNGTKDRGVSSMVTGGALALSNAEGSIPSAPPFYIGYWQRTPYVFAPDQDGNYKMIRKASVIDIDNLPELP